MSRSILLAVVLGTAACASDGPVEISPDQVGEPASEHAPVPLAEVEGEGAAIRWFAPDAEGDDLVMQVEATFPARPLVDPALLDTLSAVRVYLAAVEPDRALPDALVRYATAEELALSRDLGARTALRAENLARLASFAPNIEIAEANPAECDAAFRNWARAAYGPAYGDSSTCTNDAASHSHTGHTWYCDLPGLDDCDYPLAEVQACQAQSCTAVRGDTTATRSRFAVWPNGSPWFAKSGIRARLGFANCSPSYTAVQRRQRNNGAWHYLNIPPRSLHYHVQGAADPRPGAYPTLGLLGGFWKQVIDSSSPNYLQNRQEIVAPTQGYVCSDVITRFETFDASPLSCNFGQRLCDDNSCTGWGNCWD